MNWQQLLSSKRLGKDGVKASVHERRSEFQREYDRLIFSSAFRRMQNKTQVFPLPGSVFVHNRLTHSLEVSSVGRSLGSDVASELLRVHPELADTTEVQSIGAIVSAACLAHDMGNPPFGHSGERAIRSYFREGKGQMLKGMLPPSVWSDIINFDGNANTFRLLTHQFAGRRKGGFVLTYSTLASVVKYPYSSSLCGRKSKFGFFTAEREDYLRIARELGLAEQQCDGDGIRFSRHPLVYLVEAADDICYEIMDIEDAFKLRLLSYEEASGLLLNFFPEDEQDKMKAAYPGCTDLNDQMVYYRSCVIGALESACVKLFIDNEASILAGKYEGSLIDHVPERLGKAYKRCQEVAVKRIYNCKEVTDIDLAGYHIIYTLLDLVTEAVTHPDKAYSQLLLGQASSQYELRADDLATRIMAVLDYLSGMTDVYALDLYRKINGHSLPMV